MRGTTKALLILSALGASVLTNFSPAPANTSNLVNNGDFENGLNQTEWLLLGSANIASYDGYRAIGGIGVSSSEPFLVNFNDANRVPDGSISQTISTVVGQKYVLSFLYGNYKSPGVSIGTQSIKVDVLDSSDLTSLVSLIITDPTGNNNLGDILSSYSLSFIATSSQTKIQFSDNGSDTDATDGLLDNISVTPVP